MDFASLHDLLRSTYDEMMPLCAQMSGIAKGIAGLGALFYIALRVWGIHCHGLNPSMCFPCSVPLSWDFASCSSQRWCWERMNAVLSPVVQGTEAMVHQQETRWRSW